MGESRLQQLSKLGQSVWIDYLSRRLIHEGELEKLMREHAVVGVTSNPTIFQKAIAEGDAYDEQFREVLTQQEDPKEVFFALAIISSIAGKPAFVAGIFTNRFGLSISAWRRRASAIVPSVSRARFGSTSIET